MHWLSVLFVLLANGVPLYGVKLLGWSATTVLVLFWFENLLAAVLTCIRIAVHRQLTRKRGHWRAGQLGLMVNGKPSKAGLLGEYATMAFVFTLAHGVFVFFILLVVRDDSKNAAMWTFSGAQFRQGAQWIAAVSMLDLLIDLSRIKTLSYAALKSYVQARMGRVIVLHLTIIFGMFAMMVLHSPFALLYILIALKTLFELATVGGVRAKTTAVHAAMATEESKVQSDAAAVERRNALEDEQVMPA